jgi:hypothetical protein
MILTEKEIRDLLSKDFKQVKKTSSGEIFNQYTYDEKECLNLIESYIYERKGQKIGDIQSPSFALKQHGQLGGLFFLKIGANHVLLKKIVNLLKKYLLNKQKRIKIKL